MDSTFDKVIDALPRLSAALGVTVTVFVASLVLATLLGVALALARQYGPRAVRFAAAGYSWFFRSLPLLVVLFVVYYGAPYLGPRLDPLYTAIFGLALSSAAYMSELFRTGLLAVAKDQQDAAIALGLSRVTALRRIVLPPALVTAIPTWTSNAVVLLRGTSLASLVAVSELTGVSYSLVSTTFQPVYLLIAAAAYLALSTVIIRSMSAVERRCSRGWRHGADR